MGQTLVENYEHIVFSTKNRFPFIAEEIENELFSYIGGICKGLDCQPLNVGGYKDHIHILVMLNKNIALAKLMEVVKANSSTWVSKKSEILKKFSWQAGYAGFSVSKTNIEAVRNYIVNQKKHHQGKVFQDELGEMLTLAEIIFDEKYIWD